ncbi:MAG TPA: hypothetical protein VGO03_21325 [Acidimicrobiia bacterium]|jgi:hypothetical protein
MLLRVTSQDRSREIVQLMRLGGVALLVGGAAGPVLSRRIASVRMYLDEQAWGWLDPPGRLMQGVGSTLIAGSDRRGRRRSAPASSGQKVIVA